MGQLHLHRFEYRGAVDRAEFDKTWGVGLEMFARSGNWGEPVFDMDAAFAPAITDIKAKGKKKA